MALVEAPKCLPIGLTKDGSSAPRPWLHFVCGSLITAHLTHVQEVKADSNRVFELMVYHAEPGKVHALESVFKDVSKLQTKHGLNVIGYWVPNDDSPAWKDTFIYLIAHPSQGDAKKNWDALHADPVFLPYRNAVVPLIEKMKRSVLR
jgi:hypothetical protein